jgi:hypothetical protein
VERLWSGITLVSWLKHISAALATVTLITVLSGCGGLSSTNITQAPSFYLPPSTDRVQFLQSFVLLDQNGQVAPPVMPGVNGTPAGVMLGFMDNGDVVFCTVMHIIYGVVPTAKHCTDESSNPANYYLLFFNNNQQLEYTTIQGFGLQGNTNSYDATVMYLPQVAADAWTPLNGQVVALNGPTPVTIWAYDPVSSGGSIIGMQWDVRQAEAAIGLMPTAVAEPSNQPIQISGINPQFNFIVDHFVNNPVQGNSGATVTVASAPQALVGDFTWKNVIDASQDQAISYMGTLGQQMLPDLQDPNPQQFMIFGVGSAYQFDVGAFMAPDPCLLAYCPSSN